MKTEKFIAYSLLLVMLTLLDSCSPKKTVELDKIISKGGASGKYNAFADVCRMSNGDIMAVYYAGYDHVTRRGASADYPQLGRIVYVKSQDEGRTWSEPALVYDSENDDRDPSIVQLSNGRLICNSFPDSLLGDGVGWDPAFMHIQLVESFDNGITWEKYPQKIYHENWASSSPIRVLRSRKLVMPVYYVTPDYKKGYGGVMISTDNGKTWSDPIPIGDRSKLYLPAETDIIQLQNGELFAALRGSRNDKINMHYATSSDEGQTWSDVHDIGFLGSCPYFLRLRTGAIILSYRGSYNTADGEPEITCLLRVSYDDSKTWQGPYIVKDLRGAYPSMIELKDGSVLMVGYDGPSSGSEIFASRFFAPAKSDTLISLSENEHPILIRSLPF